MADKRLGYGKPKGNGIAIIIIAIWVVGVAGVAIVRTFVQSGGSQ